MLALDVVIDGGAAPGKFLRQVVEQRTAALSHAMEPVRELHHIWGDEAPVEPQWLAPSWLIQDRPVTMQQRIRKFVRCKPRRERVLHAHGNAAQLVYQCDAQDGVESPDLAHVQRRYALIARQQPRQGLGIELPQSVAQVLGGDMEDAWPSRCVRVVGRRQVAPYLLRQAQWDFAELP